MNTSIQQQGAPDAVPADFWKDWAGRATLLSLIVDAAQTVDWPESDFALTARSGYAFRRPSLLALVTYCHATGVHDPKDIAAKAARDDVLQLLWAGTYPTWQVIQDFQRRHGDSINQSLIEARESARRFGLRTRLDDRGTRQRARRRRDVLHATRVDFDDRSAPVAETGT